VKGANGEGDDEVVLAPRLRGAHVQPLLVQPLLRRADPPILRRARLNLYLRFTTLRARRRLYLERTQPRRGSRCAPPAAAVASCPVVAWAKAFRVLVETRGGKTGQGERNDREIDEPEPTRFTVKQVAGEAGVSRTTAWRRLKLAKDLEPFLPAPRRWTGARSRSGARRRPPGSGCASWTRRYYPNPNHLRHQLRSERGSETS
jgi:hypothetical protein